MKMSTYSFEDLAGAIAHPQLGAYTFTGEGIGSINIAMAGDNSAHDVAADGSVMVSKIIRKNGTITIVCQQTSNVHKWLLAAFNALYIAPPDQWASMGATLRNTTDGTSHVIAGMSFQKIADKPYQAQGQTVTWGMMAAEIESVTA